MSIVESDGRHLDLLMRAKLGRVQNTRGYSTHTFNPITPTERHLVLSAVSLASKDPRWRPVGLNDLHLRSHGKIGDCKQSSNKMNSVLYQRGISFKPV